MAKNKKSAMPGIEALSTPEPTTMLRITQEQAGGVSVGDKVTVSVSGEVKGVRESWDGKGFELDLKNSKTSGISGNAADKELNRMKGI